VLGSLLTACHFLRTYFAGRAAPLPAAGVRPGQRCGPAAAPAQHAAARSPWWGLCVAAAMRIRAHNSRSRGGQVVATGSVRWQQLVTVGAGGVRSSCLSAVAGTYWC
jgi:hypothetical protein